MFEHLYAFELGSIIYALELCFLVSMISCSWENVRAPIPKRPSGDLRELGRPSSSLSSVSSFKRAMIVILRREGSIVLLGLGPWLAGGSLAYAGNDADRSVRVIVNFLG